MGRMSICIRTQNFLLTHSLFGAHLVTSTAVLQPRRGVPLLASTERSISFSRRKAIAPPPPPRNSGTLSPVLCRRDICQRICLPRQIKDLLLLREFLGSFSDRSSSESLRQSRRKGDGRPLGTEGPDWAETNAVSLFADFVVPGAPGADPLHYS